MKKFLTKVLTVILSVATILTVMPKMTFADDGQAAAEETAIVLDLQESVQEETEIPEIDEIVDTPVEEEPEEVVVIEDENLTQDDVDVSADETEMSSEDVTQAESEEQTEETVAEETVAEEISEEETTEVETAEEETTPEEETTKPEDEKKDDKKEEEKKDVYGEVDLSYASGVDLSNGRLIVIGAEIIDKEYLISSYNGLNLLQYKDIETATKAYAYYSARASFVTVDTQMVVADDENVTPVPSYEIMTEGENPLDRISDQAGAGYGYDIALIDTGASATDAVSMIDEGAGDSNGHGSRMLAEIWEQAPGASVLSIKAFDASGRGDVSAIYAAFEYAINANVRIINFSASAWATEENSIITDVIYKAIGNGIIVVGAGGNSGSNAAYTVPGCVGPAYIIGACAENGERLGSSNFGTDYNVVAESTSVAAAKFSGFIAANGLSGIDEVLNGGLIFEPEYELDNGNTGGSGEFVVNDTDASTDPTGAAYENSAAWYVPWCTIDASYKPSDFAVGNSFSVNATIDSHWWSSFTDFQSMKSYYGWGRSGQVTSHTYVHQALGNYDSTDAFCPFKITSSNDSRISLYNDTWLPAMCVAPSVSDWAEPRVVSAKCTVRQKYSDGSMLLFLYISTRSASSAQDRGVFLKVYPATGYVTLQKSAQPAATSGLDGAVYDIFTSGGTYKASFVTGAGGTGWVASSRAASGTGNSWNYSTGTRIYNGYTYVWSNNSTLELEAGSYYVVEFAPPGNGKYLKNTARYNFTVSSGATTPLSGVDPMIDKAKYDPIGVVLKKDPVEGSGTVPSMEGALFSFKFYEDIIATSPASVDSASVTRSWVYKTNASGGISLAIESLKVSGDALYYDSDNRPSLPQGTLVVTETQAPEGFFVNDTTYYVTIEIDDVGTRTRSVYKKAPGETDWTYIGNSIGQVDQVSDLSMNVEELLTPTISTVALDNITGTHVGVTQANDTITDTVYIENAFPGMEYTLTAELRDADTDEVIATVTRTSKAPASTATYIDYEVTMPAFRVNSSSFAGKTVVVYEYMSYADTPDEVLSEHTELVEEQIIRYPDVSTSASDKDTGNHVGSVKSEAVVIDEVSCTNLVIGQKYSVSGTLRYQNDFTDVNGVSHRQGDAVSIKDSSVAEVEFTATENNMVIELTYVVDSTLLEGATVVVFEDLYAEDVKVASHADLDDEEQSVHYPKIRTTAIDADTEDVVGASKENATIRDAVEMKNLVVGETYTVEGRLIDQATGAEVQQDSITMTGETFTAAASEETHYVTFTGIDATLLEGHSLVVFEKLYVRSTDGSNKEATRHEDITDLGQTVNYPEVKTNAIDSKTGDHVGTILGEAITAIRRMLGFDVLEEGQQQIIDTVSLTNLVNGKTYTLEGVLKNKATGEDIVIDGETVKQTVTIEVSGGKFIPSNGGKTTVTNYDEEAQTVSGTVELTFTLDSAALVQYGTVDEEGVGTVVFETLKYNNIEVAAHANLEDEAQSVYEVSIRTTAIDEATGDHIGDSPKAETTHSDFEDAEVSTIIDTVHMEGLAEGQAYELRGKLVITDECTEEKAVYLKADGTSTENADEAITVTKPFEATGYEMDLQITFTVDSELVSGKSITVFETLYHAGVLISAHADSTDEAQTIWYPLIETELVDAETESKHAYASENMKLIDTVTYTNLKVGETYSFFGILYDKDTAEPVLDDAGNQITSELVDFVAPDANGTVELEFTFSGVTLAGKEIVAFERLEHNGIDVYVHADIEDEDQTVMIPKIGTSLKTEAGDNEVLASKEMKLVDTVSYSKLYPDKTYKLTGTLMDKATGKPVLDDEGNEITAETEFTPEEKDGTVEVVFEFSGESLASFTLVAYEELVEVGVDKVIADHKDITDEEQTVTVPEIQTELTGKEGEKLVSATKVDIELVDTVEYKNLRTDGREYTVTGILMDKETGEPALDDDGNEITSFTTFVPEESDGHAEVTFKFKGYTLMGYDLVAFEDLTTEYGKVAVHAEIDDESQTVEIPGIGTQLVNAQNGSHVINANEEIVLIDEVAYKNFLVGETYTITGFLYDKSGGDLVPVKDEAGKLVTASTTFEAKTADGTVEVEFKFSNKALGGAIIVCFEYATVGKAAYAGPDKDKETVPIAEHADKDDQAQMVRMPYISTELTMKDTSKKFTVTGSTTSLGLNDAVTLDNLDLGDVYVIRGVLVNPATGKYIKADGTETDKIEDAYTVQKKFKVTQNFDGKINLQFEFSGSALQNLKHNIVAYEYLYVIADDGSEVAVAGETDPKSEAQTVSYYETPNGPSTGDNSRTGFWMLLMIVALIGLMSATIIYRKNIRVVAESAADSTVPGTNDLRDNETAGGLKERITRFFTRKRVRERDFKPELPDNRKHKE